MMSEQEAADVIFAEVENAIGKLRNGESERALKTLLRVRGTIAAHALKNTQADIGSIHWYQIVDVLQSLFPQANEEEE